MIQIQQQLNSLRQDLTTISNMANQLSQSEQHNSMQLQRMHQMAEGISNNIQHISGGAQQFGSPEFRTSSGQSSPFMTQQPYSTQFGAHPNMGVVGATSNPIGAALGQNFIGQGQTPSRGLAPVNTPFENPIGAAQRSFEHSYEQPVHPNMGLVGHSSNPIAAAHRQNLNYGHQNTSLTGQTMHGRLPQGSSTQWETQQTNPQLGTNVSFSGTNRPLSGFGS